jgi:phosphoribosylanthranilate isomerase
VRIFVKICGLNSGEAVNAAVAAGADAVGFVLAESPRQVDPAQAARLAARVPPGIIRVAVFRHPREPEVRAALAGFSPDWLQTDAEDFDDDKWGLSPFVPFVTRLPVYRDVPGLDEARLRREPRVLFEAAASGAGQRANWQRAAALAQSTQLVLAGGLTPDNVGEAIAVVRPWGVDVSSGVEASRGVKDPAKIAAFVAAVRAAERALGMS